MSSTQVSRKSPKKSAAKPIEHDSSGGGDDGDNNGKDVADNVKDDDDTNDDDDDDDQDDSFHHQEVEGIDIPLKPLGLPGSHRRRSSGRRTSEGVAAIRKTGGSGLRVRVPVPFPPTSSSSSRGSFSSSSFPATIMGGDPSMLIPPSLSSVTGKSVNPYSSSSGNSSSTVYFSHHHPILPEEGFSPLRLMSSRIMNVNWENGSTSTNRPADTHHIEFHHLRIERQLGRGHFSNVFQARYRHQFVAVKMLTAASVDVEKAFSNEVEINRLITPHPNVVRFIGACTDNRKRCIVTEFCMNGSLSTWIRKNSISYNEKLHVALGAARGLQHVHSQGVIHRDVAARNFLVSANRQVKICDFGLAKTMEELARPREDPPKKAARPVRWMAPEALRDRVYDTKTDVFSFGVALWEIFSGGEVPYGKRTPNKEVKTRVVSGTLSLPRPSGCAPSMWAIMSRCMAHDNYKRPEMEEIVEQLSRMLGISTAPFEGGTTTAVGESFASSANSKSSDPSSSPSSSASNTPNSSSSSASSSLTTKDRLKRMFTCCH